jgi:hypothetical protein
MYYTIADGPGAMVIFDADPGSAPAIASVVASSDAVQDTKFQRLFSGDDVAAIRQKRIQLQASYGRPVNSPAPEAAASHRLPSV